jgi:hypothetical protein
VSRATYRELSPARIIETSLTLQRRIDERFPGSSLSQLSTELCAVAQAAQEVSVWLARPIWWVRIGVTLAVTSLLLVVLMALRVMNFNLTDNGFSEILQGVEAAVNDLVFVGIAVYFLLGVETRFKRARALKELHVLRSMAHVVDMHQLTKDPERLSSIAGPGTDTASSPKRDMTPFLLTRYLDYSSELLAIISKVAAIYVQRFDDAETLRAAGDIEDLTVGLTRNIWQKIMLLDRIADGPRDSST